MLILDFTSYNTYTIIAGYKYALWIVILNFIGTSAVF